MSKQNTQRVSEAHTSSDFQELKQYYIEMLSYIERLHRLLLDVIKAELDEQKIVAINSVQALLLYNIGSMELTAGELKSRGYYQGSNVSYNLKKLVDMEYVHYERSHIDKRSVRVKLTPKGTYIADIVGHMYHVHTENIENKKIIDVPNLEDICLICKDFERFWSDAIRYRS